MRKVLFSTLVLFLPLLTIAQQSPVLIKVSARAVHIDPSPKFKALVTISGTYSSLPAEMLSLEKLKKQFKEALEEKGIPWSDIKENPNDFGYETMSYGKEGTIYAYTTTSVSSMKKFLEIKSLGLQQLNSVSIITIDDDEAKKLSEIALKKAKERALTIAKAMGKQLGDIQEVEDLNNRWGEKVESSLYYDRPAAEYIHMINVIFKVK